VVLLGKFEERVDRLAEVLHYWRMHVLESPFELSRGSLYQAVPENSNQVRRL